VNGYGSGLVSWPIAKACARERMRQAPLWVLGALVALQGVAVNADQAAASLFGGVMGPLSLLLFTLFLGAGMVSEELENGHAQLVLLRSLTRAEWFGGRLAGAGLLLFGVMALAWLFAVGTALKGGAGVSLPLLAALPVSFVWAFAWLATLAAISVVARGWSNTGWLVLAVVGWGFVYYFLTAGNALSRAAQRESKFLEQAVNLLRTLEPYLGPRNPSDLMSALQMGGAADWTPLLYDLLWASAAWLVGVLLLNRRELARRRP
jgi:ABC-type transport system involved in multi-copper enzyme maturation permease subunit